MCGGGKRVQSQPAPDPAPVNVNETGGQSAARIERKKQKQRRDINSNVLSTDRSVLSSALEAGSPYRTTFA